MALSTALKKIVPLSLRQAWSAHSARSSRAPEYNLLPTLCRRDRVSLDIGANRGIYTYWCHKYSQSVIAFEPSPAFCERIRAAFPSGVEVRQCVLSDATGRAVLRVPVIGDGVEFGRATIQDTIQLPGLPVREVEVEKLRLDDLQLRNVGFLKIDVEGHELAVLRGARALLTEQRPRILVEAEERHRPDAVSSLVAFLGALGYEGY
jgi:FkbM family methyltransferase